MTKAARAEQVRFVDALILRLYGRCRIDETAYAAAIKCLGPKMPPKLKDILRLAVANATTGKWHRVKKTDLLRAHDKAIATVGLLDRQLHTLSLLSGVSNGTRTVLNQAAAEQLPSFKEALKSFREFLRTSRSGFENGIKGTYAETTTSVERNLLSWALMLWIDCGHKVTSSLKGPFANYLDHVFDAASLPRDRVTKKLMAEAMRMAKDPRRLATPRE